MIWGLFAPFAFTALLGPGWTELVARDAYGKLEIVPAHLVWLPRRSMGHRIRIQETWKSVAEWTGLDTFCQHVARLWSLGQVVEWKFSPSAQVRIMGRRGNCYSNLHVSCACMHVRAYGRAREKVKQGARWMLRYEKQVRRESEL